MIELYLTEISKYVIAGSMAAFTIFSFLVFMYKGEKRRGWIYALQTVALFATQFACFIQIIAQTGSKRYFLLLMIQTLVLISTISMFKMVYPDGNRLLINNMCMFLMVGMIMITRISYGKGIRQFIIASASLVIAFLVPEILFRCAFLERMGWIFAGIGLAVLLILLIYGSVTNGSKINFRIAGLSFQPQEIVKIIFAFFIASILAQKKDFKTVCIVTAIAAAHVLVLVLLKDLGSALIYFVVYLCVLFVATNQPLYFLGGLLSGAAASFVAYKLFPHVQQRVLAWKDPWTEIDSTGYQITQSLFAISGGGLWGLGLYGGTPSSIPYVEEDFMFAAIAEELGIIFASCLIAVCISTFLMILLEAYKIKNNFGRLLCVGLGVTYIFQVFLTVGGDSKFIPLTGVTLPLVSYGGTSVMVTIVMLSLVEGECLVRSDERYQAYLEKKREKMNGRKK
jgi:cell division protein FtsW (lipid II flippase)